MALNYGQSLDVKRYMQALQTQLSQHYSVTRDRASQVRPMDVVHDVEEEELEEDGEPVDEKFLVSVGSRQIPITLITEEDKDGMTKEEYEVLEPPHK